MLDIRRFTRAPCYRCGYTGAGYYLPASHACARLYHDILALKEEFTDPMKAAQEIARLRALVATHSAPETPWQRDDESTELILRMAGSDVPLEVIFCWTDDQVRAAEEWAQAARALATAADALPARPAYVPPPWQDQAP